MDKKLSCWLEKMNQIKDGCYLEATQNFPAELSLFKDYLFFDQPKYTRNLVSCNDQYELMILCWEPGQETPIHDHGESEGYLLLLQGSLTEQIYHQNEKKTSLTLVKEQTLSSGEASVINESVGYHKLANKSKERVVSFHLYYKPIKKFFVYNERNLNRLQKTCSFYSIHGKRVNS